MPQLTVAKIGGALIDDAAHVEAFWQGIQQLQVEGPVVVVHGGGPQATQLAHRLGHEPRIVQGRRVTSDTDLDIMLWSLRGALNARLVAQAAQYGVRTVGLSGVDGHTLQVQKRPPWVVEGEEIDFGWVGDVDHVQPTLLHILLEAGFVPVVAPIGVDAQGQLYNVNADTVACALAAALGASRFLLITESGGVRRVAQDPTSLITRCDRTLYEQGLREGWIQGGMRVKLHVAFSALTSGVREVYIIPPQAVTSQQQGTQVFL